MYIFYIDDNRKEKAKLSLLGGFLIEQKNYIKLCNKLIKLKKENGLSSGAPIKWSPPNTPLYKEQKSLKEQSIFKKKVLKILSESPITIILAIVEEGSSYNKDIKLSYLQKSIEFLAQRFQMEAQRHDLPGLMVVDFPGGENYSIELTKHYRFLRVNGSNYPSFKIKLSKLMETIHFSHAFACEGLQLADFIVGAMGHAIEKDETEYITHLKNKIRKRNGYIKGVGVVLYPSNSLIADKIIAYCEK